MPIAHLRRIVRIAGFCFLIPAAFSLAAQTNDALSLNEQGVEAAAHSDYPQAARLYREAIRIWRDLGPAYEAHTATSLFNLGSVLCNAGNSAEAVRVLEEALQLHQHSLGPAHLRTVRNLGLLGQAYVQSGDTARADATLAEGLALARKLYPNDLVTGQILLALSLSRRVQNKFDEALQFGEEGLAATLQAAGELTSDAALAYENVGTLHRLAGHPWRAIPLLRKARFLCERTLGPASPALASLLSQEGLALLDDGKVALAEQQLSQAVDSLAALGPSGEYRLATAKSNLAILRLHQRKLADAERLLLDALAIEERLPSRPVFETVSTLETLAQLRKVQRRHAESVQLIARAAAIQSRR
ncbi:MAG: tetratricopeptide repeat protein [Candidatus Solibacter sp.]